MKNFILLIVVSFTITSCATMGEAIAIDQNLYFKNLKVIYKKNWQRSKSPISVYDFNDNNMKYFVENGYVVWAYDAIRHTYISYDDAVHVGKYYGIPIMLYKYQYVGTASGTALLSIYNPGDTYLLNSTTSGRIRAGGASGYYNSNTLTTITTPGSFSYQALPYSNDYYDQWAIYYVKKYFRSKQSISIYEKGTNVSRTITIMDPNSWFEILSEGKSFKKVKFQNQIGYISSNYNLD